MSRNVGTELQFYAIENHKRTSLPLTSRWKPEITQAPCRAIDVTFHSNSQVIAQQLGLGKSVRICSHKYVGFFCLNDKLFKAFLSSIKRSMYMPRQALDFFPLNQQSEYKVFYKLMCWLSGSLTCRLPNLMRSHPARRSLLSSIIVD